MYIAIIIFAIIFGFVYNLCFKNNSWQIDVFHTIMYCPIIGIACSVLLWLVSRIFKYVNKRNLLPIGICLSLICIVFVYKNPSPDKLFKKVIINPIPLSVRDIHVDIKHAAWDYKYVFRFDVSKDDLKSILAFKQYAKIENINCNNNILRWDEEFKAKVTFPIYYSTDDIPAWFDIAHLSNPVMYKTMLEDGHEQMLVCCDQSIGVYFIDYKWK